MNRVILFYLFFCNIKDSSIPSKYYVAGVFAILLQLCLQKHWKRCISIADPDLVWEIFNKAKNYKKKTKIFNQFFSIIFPKRLPFDWRTPSGYLAAFIIEFVIVFTAMMWLTCIIFLIVGVTSFLVLLVRDIKNKLGNLKSFATSIRSETELNKKIFAIIQSHCEAKQLS